MQTLEKISVTIADAVQISGICRSRIYELIAAEEIKSYRIGRRRLIDVEDLRRFITALPTGI